MLIERHDIPEVFLTADATELLSLLGGPTLIHLPGRESQPLFVSVLMHGNETTGLGAIQKLLLKYKSVNSGFHLPRALSLFVSNVSGASQGLRQLDSQPDYNRVWPGGESGTTPEHAMMHEVFDLMRARNPIASIDVHNNTGRNPHYACINRLDAPFLNLAAQFSRTVVYFLRPTGVQSMAFANLCPSVTLECGLPGAASGIDHAAEYLDHCLTMQSVNNNRPAEDSIDLFHTVAIVKVPPGVQFDFGRGDAELIFSNKIDELNFHECDVGTALGWVRPGSGTCLEVWDEHGCDLASTYLETKGDELQIRKSVMLSMLTTDPRIIRQDCLCYLMERFEY